MTAEAQNEAKSFTPFSPFLGGAVSDSQKLWEDSMAGFYRSLVDTWTASTRPFAVPQGGAKAVPGDWTRAGGALWKESFSSLATVEARLEALTRFAKVGQDGLQEISRAFLDCLNRVSAAREDGGFEKAIQICMESHGRLLNAMESSVLEQTRAFFDCCRSLIPREKRPAKGKAEKSS